MTILTMLNTLSLCSSQDAPKETKTIHLVLEDKFENWLKSQAQAVQNWCATNDFKGKKSTHLAIPNKDGKTEDILAVIGNDKNLYSLASLSGKYEGYFTLNHDAIELEEDEAIQLCIGWALGSYSFDTYKAEATKTASFLVIPDNIDETRIEAIARGVYKTRDLVNTPPNDMMPQHLESEMKALAQEFDADLTVTLDEELVANDFHAIYAVGKASENRPRLLDLTWGDKKHPKITLVGKGVCFDNGGLNIKTGSSMSLMKKDMGGAAQVIGLALMIMRLKLPIRLRVLVGAVENAISGNAYRPSDIIKTKKGLSVEITNTDAEGRLVLCDCLALACEEKPELIADFATLTGAARVALGPDIPPIYSDYENLALNLMEAGDRVQDPLWQLPLWDNYNSYLDSPVADLANSASTGFGGSITAGLFLKNFVDKDIPWVHIDCYAWTPKARAGQPLGGEMQGPRALLDVLEKTYAKKKK